MNIRLLKKIILIIICLIFFNTNLVGVYPFSSAGYAVDGFYLGRGGTWWDNRQCIRLSVFNIETGVCESTSDWFNNFDTPPDGCNYDFWQRFDLDFDAAEKACPGDQIYYGKGCKLEYLMQYQNVGQDIRQMSLISEKSSAQYKTYKITESTFAGYGNEYMQKFRRFTTPLWYVGEKNGKFMYDSENSFVQFMLGAPASVLDTILRNMGFCFYDNSPDKIFLDSQYVVVIEPVFWFQNQMRADPRTRKALNYQWFYGTPTEWAIYSEMTKDTYHILLKDNGEVSCEGYGIHSVMGNLTCVAAPLCTFSRVKREFQIGDVSFTVDTPSESMKKTIMRWHYRGFTVPSNYSYLSKNEYRDTIIMEMLGADYLFPKELYDISVDIQNNNFRTDTDVMLSFKVQCNKDVGFKPTYDACEAGDPYGIRLELETLPGSEINPGDMEIDCAGIPSKKDRATLDPGTGDSNEAYAYINWHTPSTPGVWKFKITAYGSEYNDEENNRESSGERLLKYESNTGTRTEKRDEQYFEFSIRVSDLNIERPENTTKNDKMPNGFSSPSGDISAYTPCTTLSWHEFVADPVTTSSGDKYVLMYRNNYTKSITMSGTTPVCYANIASAYMDRNGELVTKSGYGIGIDGHFTVDGGGGGFQNGVVLYPEYGYGLVGSLMEPNGSSGMYLEQNSYSKYYHDARNSLYSRVHFTPIWYPDGEYNVQVFMFDCWTPVGMLWDCQKYTVHINGTMYDDWYVTRN